MNNNRNIPCHDCLILPRCKCIYFKSGLWSGGARRRLSKCEILIDWFGGNDPYSIHYYRINIFHKFFSDGVYDD